MGYNNHILHPIDERIALCLALIAASGIIYFFIHGTAAEIDTFTEFLYTKAVPEYRLK